MDATTLTARKAATVNRLLAPAGAGRRPLAGEAARDDEHRGAVQLASD